MEPIIAAIQDQPITWVLVAWVFVKDILPKLIPGVEKYFDKRVSTEDRLFKVLEDNVKSNTVLGESLSKLSNTVERMDTRLQRVEVILSDNEVVKFNQWYQSLQKVEKES